MIVKYDPILDDVRQGDSQIEIVTSAPASGFNGQLVLDQSDNKIKVWWASQWQTIITLTAPVSSGVIPIWFNFYQQ